MCEVLRKRTDLSYTGYKVAIPYKGHYYSAFSGIRYKKGKVPISKQVEKHTPTKFGNHDMVKYNQMMKGKTGVFTSWETAVIVQRALKNDFNCKFVILEMTISDLLYDAYMSSGLGTFNTVIGSNINSFKKL